MIRAQSMDAPVGLLPLPRPLMTGEVLDAAFRLFRAGIFRCLPYSGLAVLVLQLPTLYRTFFLPSVLGDAGSFAIPNFKLISSAIVMTLSAALLGVITLRLDALARGIRPRFRVELAMALKRWPTAVLATSFAFGYPVLLWWLWPAIIAALPPEALVFAAVPILWPALLFALTLPAFWCDRLGPFAALALAVRISLRRTWRMAGAVLATLCMVTVFYVLSAIIVGLMSPLFGRADLFLIATVASLLYLVVGAFGVPFVLSMLIVAHQDFKLREQERRARRA
jgi:hypothetical protein